MDSIFRSLEGFLPANSQYEPKEISWKKCGKMQFNEQENDKQEHRSERQREPEEKAVSECQWITQTRAT